MKKTITIKSSRYFSRAFYKGKSFANKFMVIYYFKNNITTNRIGISIGKKVGCSVKRNHVKRLIRESYRKLENNLKIGYDIVFVPRPPSKDASFLEIYNSLQFLFRKLDILDKDVI